CYNMKQRLLFLTILLLSLFIPGIIAQSLPSDLLILTEEYPPFNYMENGDLKGISVDILESAFNHMDLEIPRETFRIVPWVEGYNTTLTRNNTLLFTTARIPQREDQFLWAGPIISDTKVLWGIAQNDSPLVQDIHSYRIVAIQDDSGIGMAENAGTTPDQITKVSSPEQAIRMVENGTADVWSYGEMSGQTMINRYADDPDRFSSFMNIGVTDEYFAFNKNTDPGFVTALNNTIAGMKTNRSETGSSEYEQIIYKYQPVECGESEITPKMVTDLVNITSDAISQHAPETLKQINEMIPPYKDPVIPGLYVFVYSLNGTNMADAGNPNLAGRNMLGKGDVTGKMFRDEMLKGAVDHRTGWVHYVFSHPTLSGIFPKKSYYRLVTGSDGVPYVVISGRYMSCAYLWHSPNANQDRSIEMEMQPDGSIVLAGTRNDSVQKDIQIIRYLSDGKKDNTFGNHGTVIYAGAAGKDDYAFGVTHDAEGNILVAGREHNGHDPDMLLLKYTPDGRLDPLFGKNGIVRYSGPGNGTDSARGVVVEQDGKVLITGEMNTSNHKEMVALRFLPDGKFDDQYGKDGIFVLNRSGNKDSYGFALALDNEDRAIITGGAVIPGDKNSSIATVRLLKDGSIDTSFGIDGLALYQGESGGPDYGNWVSILPDNKILVTGAETDSGGSYDIVVLRYNQDGTLDTTFGNGGAVIYRGTGYDYAWGQTIQADGKIIIAGTTEINHNQTPVLIRYDLNGKPDPTFGEQGIFTFDAFGTGLLYGVYPDAQGNIFANGYITKEGKDISLFVKIPGEDL
ncbi:MAG TPA: transporter substrate-binding domain-containing protein, partial [Methanospirillum sp.]|uniref:cache domain-containing protein n=1 Tax=Methanospirillum sp. TaxID=45200 RepID=UPI002CF58259